MISIACFSLPARSQNPVLTANLPHQLNTGWGNLIEHNNRSYRWANSETSFSLSSSRQKNIINLYLYFRPRNATEFILKQNGKIIHQAAVSDRWTEKEVQTELNQGENEFSMQFAGKETEKTALVENITISSLQFATEQNRLRELDQKMIESGLTILITLASFILSILFFSYSFILYLQGKINKQLINNLDKKIMILLLSFFIAAFAIRFFTPNLHLMYTDEFINMGAAKNMVNKGQPVLCNFKANLEETCQIYKKPLGFPLLLSLAFSALSLSNIAAFSLSNLAGSLSVIFLFFTAYNFSRRKYLSILAALVLAIFPLHIIWSGTVNSNIVSLLFIIMTGFMLSLFHLNDQKSHKKPLLISLVFLAIFTVQLRPENLLIIPGMIISYFLIYKGWGNTGEELKKTDHLILLFPWILLVPHLIHTLSSYYLGFIPLQLSGFLNTVQLSSFSLAMISLLSGISIVVLVSTIKQNKRWGLLLTVWSGLFLAIVPFLGKTFSRKYLLLLFPGSILIGKFVSLTIGRHFNKKLVKYSFILFLISMTALSFFQVRNRFPNRIKTIDQFQKKVPNQISMMERQYNTNCFYITEKPELLNYKTDLQVIPSQTLLENRGLIQKEECFMFFSGVGPYLNNKQWQLNTEAIEQEFSLNMLREWKGNNVSYKLYRIGD